MAAHRWRSAVGSPRGLSNAKVLQILFLGLFSVFGVPSLFQFIFQARLAHEREGAAGQSAAAKRTFQELGYGSLSLRDLLWQQERLGEQLFGNVEINVTNGRQFVRDGKDINCKQHSLNSKLKQAMRVEYAQPSSQKPRFAYVWYFTGLQPYLCSALVALRRAKRNHYSAYFPYQVDFVLLYAEDDLGSPGTPQLLKLWRTEGGVTVVTESLKEHVQDQNYKGSLQKLLALKLDQYDRVIVLDADGVPLKSLAHLFLISFPAGISIAAPQAYWFENSGVLPSSSKDNLCSTSTVLISSILLVIDRPSQSLYQRVARRFASLRNQTSKRAELFDMDLLQLEFGCGEPDEVLVLPKMYGTLDAEFDLSPNNQLSKDLEQCRTLEEVQYLHFTANGKPWSHGSYTDLRRLFGSNYPVDLARMFTLWYKHAEEVCPDRFRRLSDNIRGFQ